MDVIMDGEATQAQIGSYLTALRMKHEGRNGGRSSRQRPLYARSRRQC
jgi:hypothetical protein